MAAIVQHGDGVETLVHLHNDNSGNVTFETRQDPTIILEKAKTLHREGMHGSGEMRHAASFPRVLVDKYCQDKGITFHEWLKDKKHIRAMLQDPDLSYFRIWKGAV